MQQPPVQNPLVHVIIPKWVTAEYTFQPVPRFVILLEAAIPVGTAHKLRSFGRVTDYFIETWRTPAEIREYTHKFDMVAAPVHFAYTEIEKCPGSCPSRSPGNGPNTAWSVPRRTKKENHSCSRFHAGSTAEGEDNDTI